MEFVRTVDLHRHVEASHSVVSDASSSNENDDDTVKDFRKGTDRKSDDLYPYIQLTILPII